MKSAAIQMVSAPDLATNLATASRLIDQAVSDGAQLVSLPEYFVQMGLHETDKFQIAEEFGRGPTQELLAAKAQQRHMGCGWLHPYKDAGLGQGHEHSLAL
jgi:predicted amidohydrolase